MALVSDQKFSTFQNGGDLTANDIIVGLRDGLNTRFNFPGYIPPGEIIPINQGGTGADNAAGARVNLGLGTMATQNANAVNISGGTANLTSGTIATSPVSPTDITNKSYVDALIAGLNFLNPAYAATTVNLAGYTYNNGLSGVGATLTAGSNGAFSVDGVSPALNARILVKNQTATAQNGVYTLTTVGDGSTPAVLTRATDYNTAAQINPGDYIIVTNGSTQSNSSWVETAIVAAIGTDPITFSQFTVAIPVPVSQGGTGRSSLNTYRLLAGGTTSTGIVQSVNAGSNGQLLQSKGNAALPDYTTATYPSTATGTGTILRADGTNWVQSTSTYPDTVTSQNLIYASGTNVVGQLTPGTGVITALGQNVSGSGSIALTTSPTFTTPTLGAATATSITFGTTALSIFETGTWTPTITATTVGDLAVTYGTAAGTYTRINSKLFFTAVVFATNMTYTTAAGAIRMGGFPIAGSASSATIYFQAAPGGAAFAVPANTVAFNGNIASGATTASLTRTSSTAGTINAVLITAFTTGNAVVFNMNGYYMV